MTKKIQRKINAGQAGTKHLAEKYGDKFVCVRYIYDTEQHIRLKTVELVEEIHPWIPDKKRIPMNKIMHLSVEYGETYIGRLIRDSSGIWNKEKKYWELQYRDVIALGLEKRIIND